MFHSFIIAFSTYSKIPMPRVKWEEKGMRFSMCFFPLVGAVIGAVNLGIYVLLTRVVSCSTFLLATLLVVTPILITGGIHMDGFLDTVDAKSSYGSKEEKLSILKDPHTGAFAIIWGIVYFLLYEGLMVELVDREFTFTSACGFCLPWQPEKGGLWVYALSFVFVRALSGLSVVTFKPAKKDGMLTSMAQASDKVVKLIMVLWLILVGALVVVIHPVAGGVSVAVSLSVFWYYGQMAAKNFGGITGDLAGYFLQVAELMNLLGLVVVQLICE